MNNDKLDEILNSFQRKCAQEHLNYAENGKPENIYKEGINGLFDEAKAALIQWRDEYVQKLLSHDEHLDHHPGDIPPEMRFGLAGRINLRAELRQQIKGDSTLAEMEK